MNFNWEHLLILIHKNLLGTIALCFCTTFTWRTEIVHHQSYAEHFDHNVLLTNSYHIYHCHQCPQINTKEQQNIHLLQLKAFVFCLNTSNHSKKQEASTYIKNPPYLAWICTKLLAVTRVFDLTDIFFWKHTEVTINFC